MRHESHHRRHARAANPFALPNELTDVFNNLFNNNKESKAPASTVVSIVYVTASKTFAGPIGGYSTQGASIDTTTSPDSNVTQAPADEGASNTDVFVNTSTKTKAAATTPSSTGLPTAITSPASTSVASTDSLLAATGINTHNNSPTTSTNVSAASATSNATTSSSGGMSTAGKAGIAIGILLLVGAVLSLVLYCFKRRQAANKDRLDDEKHMFGDVNRAASNRTTATAPRLSLRPVTQFLPNLGEKRQSKGNALMMAGRPAPQQQAQRPMTPQSTRDNPFGNHHEAIDATNANGPDVVQGMGPGGEIVTGAAAAGAVVGLARGASKRGQGPKPMDFTRSGPFMGPPSPAGTEFSMSSESPSNTPPPQSATGAAIAAAGGPINSSVHRVQLDFNPSMDDELELRAGQLIRLLHEYDDGWALCIRLDRSRQGVVPRTCLSTRPVKPRPQQNGPRGGPPPGMRVPQQGRPMSPAGRPMVPNGQQPRPMSPSQQRPMTPNGQHPRPMSPAGRPMTPNGQHPRPMSPSQRQMAPNGQGRPASPSQMQNRRNSPPGPSRMNPAAPFESGSPPQGQSPIGRKPVPGQAM